MAGSSCDPVPREEEDPSLALALALQAEEDERLALDSCGRMKWQPGQQPQHQHQHRSSSSSSHAAASARAATRRDFGWCRTRGSATFGRGTAKKLEAPSSRPGGAFQRCFVFRGDRREELLMLIDAGSGHESKRS